MRKMTHIASSSRVAKLVSGAGVLALGVGMVVSPLSVAAQDEPTIGGLLEDTENLSTLRDAVDAAELTETLSDEDAEFTVFAPTNTAFDNLPDGTLDTLLEPENQEDLAALLQYHVLDSEVLSSDLEAEQTVTTLEGSELTVTVDGEEVTVTDERGWDYSVETADIEASNGVVHTIDGVVMTEAMAAEEDTATDEETTTDEDVAEKGDEELEDTGLAIILPMMITAALMFFIVKFNFSPAKNEQ